MAYVTLDRLNGYANGSRQLPARRWYAGGQTVDLDGSKYSMLPVLD